MLRPERRRIVPTPSSAVVGSIAALLAGLVIAFAAAAQEPADESKPADAADGLSGILPEEPPDGLGYEAFLVLGGNWAKWSEETAQLVGEFYAGEDRTVEQERQQIAVLRQRLQTMANALADRRFRSLWEPLTTMHGRLLRRVDLAEAMLDTLEQDPEQVKRERLIAAGEGVRQALGRLESRLRTIAGGTAWLPFVEAEKLTELMKHPADAEAALPTLQKVHTSLTDTDSLGESQREFLSREEFSALAKAIGTYSQRAGEELPPLDEEKLRGQLALLVESLESFEEEGQLSDVENAKQALAAVAEIVPDKGAQIRAVIDAHYENYNFRIVGSEEFLSRYVRETRRERGNVNEQIGGALVRGEQITTATTAVDLKKSDNGGLFDLVLNGVVRSATIAYANRANARIWSSGNHRFVARRGVRFDGEKFTLGERGTISVDPSISNTAASTKYDGGIGSSTARQRAMSSANANRGQSERRAANRIRGRVLPEFEQETDKEFQQLNKDVDEQWNKKLEEAKLVPVDRQVASTDEHLIWSSRVARPNEFSGGATNLPPRPDKGVQIQVHETLLNAMFDRMNIAGRTMTDAEFRKEVDDYFAILFGSSAEPKAEPAAEEADPDLYVFAETDPIRFHAEGDKVFLVIRTGIRQPGKDEIPTQKITVPLTYRLEGDQVVIERGTVQVSAIERPKSRSEQIVRARVMGAKIEKDLQNRTRPREINLSRGEGKEDLVLNVQRISSLNGWVTIWAD